MLPERARSDYGRAMIWLILSPALAAPAFDNVTADARLTMLSNYAAAWGDIDDDGDPDLFTSGQLWRNHGGLFARVPGLTAPGQGFFGDADNDGDLDLFAFSGGPRVYLQQADGRWRPGFRAFPDSGIVDSRGAAWADFDNDGLLDVYIGGYESAGYEPDELYLANGDGSYSLAWTEEPSGPYTTYTKPGRGVTVCDFDEDGDQDVYVSNYRLEQNNLWINDGAAGFEEVALSYGVAGKDFGWDYSFGHTIGSAWGDLDNDGDFDLFVGNFSHAVYFHDRPMFLENRGADAGWTFADRSADAGLAWQESYASPALGDYDNDGDLDLFFTTVYSGDHPVLYRNDGDWGFTDVTFAEGLAGITATYQASWADVDQDGQLDLVSGGDLYRNRGNDNHWLLVRLEGNGDTSNRSAIGAQVRIDLGDRVITRQVEAGTGEGNMNDLTLHFGLGDEAGPVDLDLRWPDGTTQTLPAVELDQFLRVEQGAD